MNNDLKAYMALHGPFALWMLWMWSTEYRNNTAKLAAFCYLLIHTITIVAYVGRMGDDFAIGAYWFMYLAIPALMIYLKHLRKEPEERHPGRYFALALAGVPITGFLGVLLAFTVAPFSFK